MRDIPEEMVEKGAQGMATACGRADVDTLPESDQEYFRSKARAVLAAALAGRQVVELPDDGHCSKCGQPFPENIRDVVLTEPRLPFDARDRVERTLRGSGHDPSTAGLVAHRIMLALTGRAAGSGSGED